MHLTNNLRSFISKLVSHWSIHHGSSRGRHRKPLKRSGRRISQASETLEVRQLLTTIMVTRLDDVVGKGDGVTLREALQAANTNQPVDGVSGELGHDTIVFSPGLTGTLALTQGQLSIQETVTIHGLGEALTRIDAQQLSRVFDIEARAGNVLLTDLSILNGFAPQGENGGGIRSRSAGLVSLTHCTVSDNSVSGTDGFAGNDGADDVSGVSGGSNGVSGTNGGSAAGGGIWSTADLLISYSTISGNTATGGVGGDGGRGGMDSKRIRLRQEPAPLADGGGQQPEVGSTREAI